MSGFEVDRLVGALRDVRQGWRASQRRSREPAGREFPSRDVLAAVIEQLKGALFPMRLGPADLRHDGEDFYVARTLDAVLHVLFDQARLELRYVGRHDPRTAEEVDAQAHAAILAFGAALPGIRERLDTDVIAAYQGDPAAHSVDEVLLCYPGVLALIHHRLAHRLYGLGLPLIARIVAELAHAQTGIDIHPGASIGEGCFIDHGTGVVIGETAVIGARVRIYQAVTLGAKRFPVDAHGLLQKGLPRHPVVEDEVVIYAGATILGRVTIGRGAVVGGNVWLTEDVPPGASVTQAGAQNHASAPREDALAPAAAAR